MRHFNRGYALGFLFIIIISLAAVRFTHERVNGRYQEQFAEYGAYTLDDWLSFFKLEEILGDPPVTPVPMEQILGTPVPQS